MFARATTHERANRNRKLAYGYTFAILAAWLVMPEIRRLIDWRAGFHAVEIFSIVPQLLMVPLVVPVVTYWRNYPSVLRGLSAVWLCAFTYALLLSIIRGNITAAVYVFAQFLLPLIFGLWCFRLEPDPVRLSRWLGSILLLFGAILSVYGILQWVAPPPWDVEWMNNVQLSSIGEPRPFEIRIFSLLSSPQPLAAVLVIVILWNLPQRTLREKWKTLPLVACVAALILTFARSGWLMLALGVTVYSVMTPRRGRALVTAALIIGLPLFGAQMLPHLSGGLLVDNPFLRTFETLTQLDDDVSAIARREEVNRVLKDSIFEPLGQGLGSSGPATQLNNYENVPPIDNGYIGRLSEMGYPGTLAYVSVLLGALAITLRRWGAARRRRKIDAVDAIAGLLALQIMLLGYEFSAAVFLDFTGMLFWLTVIIALKLSPDGRFA